jgi:hypothetical protein
LLSPVVGLLSACPDVSLRSVSSSNLSCYNCNKQGHSQVL